jgi:hypothetical protein
MKRLEVTPTVLAAGRIHAHGESGGLFGGQTIEATTDWLSHGNETGSGYLSTASGSLKLVSISCARRISANESKKANVDSAP